MDKSLKIRTIIFEDQCQTCSYATGIYKGKCHGDCCDCKKHDPKSDNCFCCMEPTLPEYATKKCKGYISSLKGR